MLLNLLYLAVVSFFIDRALNFNLSDKTYNYFKTTTIVIGFAISILHGYISTIEAFASLTTPVILIFTIHLLNIIKKFNTK
jgi:hypothetical protein